MAAPPAAEAPAAAADIPQEFVDVLTSAIPTEPLVAYTAILGFIAGVANAATSREYLPLRWCIFGAFLVLIVIAVGVSYSRNAADPTTGSLKREARLPWAEGGAALLAGAAWGLAMPGSAFNGQLTGNVRAIASAIIAIGAAAVLAVLFVPPLKTGTSKNGGMSPTTGAMARAPETSGEQLPQDEIGADNGSAPPLIERPEPSAA